MDNQSTEFILGSKEELSHIFSYDPTSGIHLADWLGHSLNQTLKRDLFYGAWADVWVDGDTFGAKLTSPTQPMADYGERFLQFMDAGRLGYEIYQQNLKAIERNELKFLMPNGLSMAFTRSIQLLHFPPIETLNYRDYLYSPTNVRWESLLILNSNEGQENSILERIVDAVPLAAAGGDSLGIKPFNNTFIPYGKQMLKAALMSDGENTQPVVAYGSPVRGWIKEAYSDQVTDWPDLMTVKSLQVVDSEAKTPILFANHPSKFFYFKDEKPEWALKVTRQDLAAARWQLKMSKDYNLDPQKTLKKAIAYWDKRPDQVSAICEAQKTQFGFDHKLTSG